MAKVLLSGLLSLFLAVSCFVARPGVPASFSSALRLASGPEAGVVGPVGEVLAAVAAWGLGPWFRWLLVLVPWAWLPFQGSRTKQRRLAGRRAAFAALVTVLALMLLGHPILQRAGVPARAGGSLGAILHQAVESVLGALGAFLIPAGILAFLLIRILPPLRVELPFLDRTQELLEGWGRMFSSAGLGLARVWRAARNGAGALGERWRARRQEAKKRRATEGRLGEPEIISFHPHQSEDLEQAARDSAGQAAQSEFELERQEGANLLDELGLQDAAETMEPEDAELAAAEGAPDFSLSRDPSELTKEERAKRRRRRRGAYPLPPLETLDDVPKESRGFSREVLQMNAQLLMDTLASFGIEGRINEIRPGPVVTTFEFEPDRGVRVSQITSRSDDIALAMRAIRIRIEAPIPGKAAVGIEVPNPFPQTVTLKEVLGSLERDDTLPALTVGLGKDTEGNPVTADLADMPHLLVAGATGSGKSVCLNSLICSLLLRNGPDRVRLLLIDPKMLELSTYNGIPHLLHPVITDPKEALKALKLMVVEMTVRYNTLAKHGVRNIHEYNAKVKAGKIKDAEGAKVEDAMNYIVIIVDELADLMMLLGSELETPIARLAQMARAVGIHLVLATQRPSVNVITGVIKANFPSRIGFRVISKVDSRTILDVMGAEALLGKGDSLFIMGGMSQPKRVHGAFLSTEECERIAEHWIPLAEEVAQLDLMDADSVKSALDLGEDDLLEDARRIVVLAQSGSTSMLQRKLRVGYTRAARLMDMLEELGVVGPFEGSKAREVLVSPEEFEAEG